MGPIQCSARDEQKEKGHADQIGVPREEIAVYDLIWFDPASQVTAVWRK
jgi:hypothetical protein